MHKLFLLIAIVAGLTIPTEARTISATVTDADDCEPIAHAMVQAIDNKGKAVAFTSTDASGKFSLNTVSAAQRLRVRFMGYDTEEFEIDSVPDEIRMHTKATVLRDVVVDAPDIIQRHDTLVFNVEKYAHAQDNAIIDVLKRLPGMRVDKDGTITYNGEPINKLYVDGNDILGGQYGLATNNISPDDVKSIEVMENHQPIKALEDIEFSDQAGINLKLKEDARLRWVGQATAGTGFSPMLYDGQLFMMRIAKRHQNMITLRSNNTGWNPATQIIEHSDGPMFNIEPQPLWRNLISADLISSPLPERRTRDNFSALANIITAWHSGQTANTLRLNYVEDRLDYYTSKLTHYFDPAIPDFAQCDNLRTRTHDADALWKAEINSTDYFLKNRLSAHATWKSGDSHISGSETMLQDIGRRDLSVCNSLRMLKKSDTRVVSISSLNSIRSLSENLTVVPGAETLKRQSIHATEFRSVTESGYSWIGRRWDASIDGGIDFDWRRNTTGLSGISIPYPAFSQGDYYSLRAYVSPRFVYDSRSWRTSVSIPASWHLQMLHERQHYSFLSTSPGASVRWQMTAKSDIKASVSYSISANPIDRISECMILSNFRNIELLRDISDRDNAITATLAYRWRNPMRAFFINLRGSYAHIRSTAITNQIFVDDMVVSMPMAQTNNANIAGGTLEMSKGFRHGRIVTGLDISHNYTHASTMRNNIAEPYSQNHTEIKPYIRGSLMKWLSMDYTIQYERSSLRFADKSNLFQTVNHSIHLTMLPNDNIQLTIGADHYFTQFSTGNHANMVLVDASAQWEINSRWRVDFVATNLLNRRNYSYSSFGTLSQTDHIFNIRPRNLMISATMRF